MGSLLLDERSESRNDGASTMVFKKFITIFTDQPLYEQL